MSPEERARSLYLEGETTPQTERGIATIAQAIREAENDALERAATAAYSIPDYVVRGENGEWLPGSPYDRGRAAAAEAIRSLKHKGDQ